MAANPGFYLDNTITALTASFVAFSFGCNANFLRIKNQDTSGSNKLQWSFDGTTLHGSLLPGEFIEVQAAKIGAIQLRYATGAPAYSLIALA